MDPDTFRPGLFEEAESGAKPTESTTQGKGGGGGGGRGSSEALKSKVQKTNR
jgi:hypothetical protein